MLVPLCAIARTTLYSFTGTQGEALRATRAMLYALPPMTPAELREASSPYRAMRLLPAAGMTVRPLRAPHYSISPAGMFGSELAPGELSFAHPGVMLDAPSFGTSTLRALPDVLRRGHSRGMWASPVAVVLGSETAENGAPLTDSPCQKFRHCVTETGDA